MRAANSLKEMRQRAEAADAKAITPEQAAVIAAAKNWAANQRGWLKPVDEALAEAVDALRAQEGE